MAPTRPVFDGVLFFPVTPFTETGEVDLDALARHIASGVDAGPGGVFIACGTGEFHALEPQEFGSVVRTAVEVVAGRVPVYAGAGGSVAQAKLFAKTAKDAGADGLLLLPPYLVEMPQAGLVAYVRDVAAATDLPRDRLQPQQRPLHRGVRDRGVEDPERHRVQGRHRRSRQRRAHRPRGHRRLEGEGKDFLFFNGMPTAETTQQAYRAIGVPLYSSATFAFAPDLALAFYDALETGNDALANALLREFFHPLVRLRDTVPGYAVSLVKAGVTLEGIPAGPVRPPLVMPSAEDVAELRSIIAAGRAVLAEALTEAL